MKRKEIILVVLGAVLILSALSLSLYNRMEAGEAEKANAEAMAEIKAAMEAQSSPEPDIPLPEAVAPVITAEAPESGEHPVPTATPVPQQAPAETPTPLPVSAYEGYLSIPRFGVELAILSEFDYAQLKIAPCRQFGSAKGGDLVIAAHNYNTHFGPILKLQPGDSVSFTEMDGTVHAYIVSRIEKLQPEEVDKVVNSDSQLMLYTCSRSGGTRHTVFCARVEGEGDDAA